MTKKMPEIKKPDSLFEEIKKTINGIPERGFPAGSDRELLHIIKNKAENFLKGMLAAYRGKHKGQLRKTIVKAGSTPEAILERLLTNSIPNVFNQYNFLSGILPAQYDHQTKRMNVDLVLSDSDAKGTIKAFIELKDGADNPFLALCELLMYFFLFKTVKNKGISLPCFEDIVDLCVLAPWEYYKKSDMQSLKAQSLRLVALLNEKASPHVRIRWLVINKRPEDIRNQTNWDFDELVHDI